MLPRHVYLLQVYNLKFVFIHFLGKLEEAEIPSVRELNDCTENTYTSELIIETERLILNKLQWELCIVTPFHFLGIYMQEGFSSDDLLNGTPMGVEMKKRMGEELLKFSEVMTDIARSDFNCGRFLPSQIAAAAAAIARKVYKITPTWSPRFEILTGYSWDRIDEAVSTIWSMFEQNFSTMRPSPRSMS